MAGADRQGAEHQLHLRSICRFTLPDLGHTVPANPSVAFVLTYLENQHPRHFDIFYFGLSGRSFNRKSNIYYHESCIYSGVRKMCVIGFFALKDVFNFFSDISYVANSDSLGPTETQTTIIRTRKCHPTQVYVPGWYSLGARHSHWFTRWWQFNKTKESIEPRRVAHTAVIIWSFCEAKPSLV